MRTPRSGWLVVLTLVAQIGCVRYKQPIRYEIPLGHVGWVAVQFAVPGQPPLPVRNGYLVAHVSPEGTLRTSTPFEDGVAPDLFVEGDDPIADYQPGKVCRRCVMDIRVLGSGPGRKGGAIMAFFVGSGEQHSSAANTLERFIEGFEAK